MANLESYIAVITSGVAILLGLVFSYIARINLLKSGGKKSSNSVEVGDSLVRESVADSETRILVKKRGKYRLEELQKEAQVLIEKHERAAKLSKRAANWLSLGQLIIGGALTTHFVRNFFSDFAVGLLGLLVFISTLIYHKLQPFELHQKAVRKCNGLKKIMRDSLNSAAELESGVDGADSYFDIIRKFSRDLGKIDNL